MPFQSKAQQGFMFSQHPQMAKEFASKTPNMKSLPNRAHGEGSSESETPSDRGSDSPAVRAREYGPKKKGKKNPHTKAQLDAIHRRMHGGKGSGRN